MKENIIKENNAGFSLVELIVSMLAASIITLAVSGLLVTGLNMYEYVSTESALQLEAQAGLGRLSELMREAKTMTYYSNDSEDGEGKIAYTNGTDNGYKIMVVEIAEKEGTGVKQYRYYAMWSPDEGQLLIDKEDASETMRGTSDIITTLGNDDDKYKYLLAQYVSDFGLKKSPAKDKGLYTLEMKLENNGINYNMTKSVSLRNK